MSNLARTAFPALMALSLSACSQAAPLEPTEAIPAREVLQEAGSDDASAPGPRDSEEESSFALDPNVSEARFIIGEILANSPNTVIGVNNQIQGAGILNLGDPQLSRLDAFVIDASGFVTDSSLRNRAIRDFILESGQHPTIRFQPTDIMGLPGELVIGEIVPFEVTGLLTIRDIAQEVTFSGEASMVAENRIEGLASATVLRSDFNLQIPSVPRVAGVDEEVILEIQFVAVSS